jgi:Beta-propeller repeat
LPKASASNAWVRGFLLTALLAVMALTLMFAVNRKQSRSKASTEANPEVASAAARAQMQAAYAALPLAFEQNLGQTDERVKYMARTRGYTLFLTQNEAVFSLQNGADSSDRSVRGKSIATRAAAQNTFRENKDGQDVKTAVVDMQLIGANPPAKIAGGDELPGKSNYFIGKDPKRWHSNVPQFARVSYEEVYPGVNLAFHGAQQQLEFDFVVAANAGATPISFRLRGAKNIRTDGTGDLVISSVAGDVRFHKPVAYQQVNGRRQAVDASFALTANNTVGFQVGNYDHSRELVIDPSVEYATYLGGTSNDAAEAIAIDSKGDAFVTGQTASANFPGFSSTNKLTGTMNAFVTEMNPTGSNFIYSTYVGGSASDGGYGIALDKSGDAFVVGATDSADFPVTSGAYQASLPSGATNAFIVELNGTGAVTYGTFFGGSQSDTALGIAFDQATGVYAVAGQASSADFPTKNALQASLATGSTSNGFVSLWNSSGNTLTFSTYLGAATGDIVNAVALDSSDNVYVTGKTSGPTFPTTTGAFQTTCGTGSLCNGGLSDAFVTVYNSAGSKYVYSTFLGGSNIDIGSAIAVDSTGAYVIGVTESNTDFPVVAGGFQTTYGGGANDAFVSKLNPTGSKLLYSSYLGGSLAETGAGIAVDAAGNAYVTGQTTSAATPAPGFPLVNATQTTIGGGYDAFVTEINPAGTALLFSTYLGGALDEDDGGNYGAIAVDSVGANTYVAGNTLSTNFPATASVYQTASGGGTDAFIAKYSQTATSSQTFSLTATSLSPGTVSPGGSATSSVSVASTNGFTGSVTLSCAVSPSVSLGPTCGAASATPATAATLTVSTTAATTSMLRPADGRRLYAAFLPMFGISLAAIAFIPRSRRKTLLGLTMVIVAISALMLMPACSSSSTKSPGGGSAGTPAGTYTITVSGTATGAAQTGTSPALTLTVN